MVNTKRYEKWAIFEPPRPWCDVGRKVAIQWRWRKADSIRANNPPRTSFLWFYVENLLRISAWIFFCFPDCHSNLPRAPCTPKLICYIVAGKKPRNLHTIYLRSDGRNLFSLRVSDRKCEDGFFDIEFLLKEALW